MTISHSGLLFLGHSVYRAACGVLVLNVNSKFFRYS